MEEIGMNIGATGIHETPVVAMSETAEIRIGEMGRTIAMYMIRIGEKGREQVGMGNANQRRMASGMRGWTLSLERRENHHNNNSQHKVCVCVWACIPI
jgi:hypothetical protein